MQKSTAPVPKYAGLTLIEKTGDRHCWGVFGPDDQLGTINFLTPERVKKSSSLVRKGQAFCLSLPMTQPEANFVKSRQPYRHTHFHVNRNIRDEVIDNLYPGYSSHMDGLRHYRFREFGYYGGREEDALAGGDLGIDHLARHCIVGRGVLVDIAAYMSRQGRPLNYWESFSVDPALLQEILASQKIALEGGDILLLRTGWLNWFLNLPPEEQGKLGDPVDNAFVSPGLSPLPDMVAFLWDNQVAMVAADNLGVEKFPLTASDGQLHRRVIPLLGMPLGEIWWLHDLAEACAGDEIYEFQVIVVPLNLPGGVRSPANAIALR